MLSGSWVPTRARPASRFPFCVVCFAHHIPFLTCVSLSLKHHFIVRTLCFCANFPHAITLPHAFSKSQSGMSKHTNTHAYTSTGYCGVEVCQVALLLHPWWLHSRHQGETILNLPLCFNNQFVSRAQGDKLAGRDDLSMRLCSTCVQACMLLTLSHMMAAKHSFVLLRHNLLVLFNNEG